MQRIKTVALETRGVLGVHDLRAEYVGLESIHADLHIEVQSGLPVEDAALIADFVVMRVKTFAVVDYCNIHTDVHGGLACQASRHCA